MSDFAEHWAARLMPDLRRQCRLAAIRIVTAPETQSQWETFTVALAGLEETAHRFGASHMPESYQRALHEELKRELVESIATVLQPWREAELTAEVVGADVMHWLRRVREWAQMVEPDRNIDPEKPDNVPPDGKG